MGLYQKYRPTTLEEIVGQPEAVSILNSRIAMDDIPHAIMFTGDSGCGKTTLALILKSVLECADIDFQNLNCANYRGIKMVRDIEEQKGRAPLSSKCRIWLIDEAQQMTKEAQSAFLNMLEFTPSHVYFMLATTDPGKLQKAIHTRCTQIKVRPLSQMDLRSLVTDIAKKEKVKLHLAVADKIAELSEGSARSALVLLEEVIGIDDPEEQEEVLQKSAFKAQAIEIAKALMNPQTKWPEMCKILKGVEEEPEGLRYMVLAYATSVLLGAGKLAGRAFLIIQAFRDNWHDCKRAGLVSACYEVINARK